VKQFSHFALNICRSIFFNIRAFGSAGLRKWNIQVVAVTRSLPLPRLKKNDGKEWSSFLVSRVRRLSQKKKKKKKENAKYFSESSSLGISERAQSVVVLGFLLTAQVARKFTNSREKMWIIKTQFVSFYELCSKEEMQNI